MTGDDSRHLLMGLLSQLRLPEESVALALLFKHKFYRWQALQSFSTLDDETLSLAVISLAAKASERPRRLREILVPAYSYLKPDSPKLTFPSELYDKLRSSLVNAELILLRVLKFELRIVTPYEYLEDLLMDFLDFSKSDKSHYNDYVRLTDSIIGTSARCQINKCMMDSRIALLYTARTIATSSVILAAESISMQPLVAKSPQRLDAWITDVAREDPGKTVSMVR